MGLLTCLALVDTQFLVFSFVSGFVTASLTVALFDPYLVCKTYDTSMAVCCNLPACVRLEGKHIYTQNTCYNLWHRHCITSL